jgi:hypothetical protein
MSNIDEIRKRQQKESKKWGRFYEITGGEIETDPDYICYVDRGALLERVEELEHQLAGCTCPTVAQLRRQSGG